MLVLAVLALALLMGGCASQQGDSRRSDAGGATAPVGDVALRRVPLEDDGLSPQLAPRDLQHPPDDPTQPWSPNYGTVRRPKEVAPSRVLPARAGATLIAMDQDAIVRQAIAEHEMRRQ
jgi:hypothetical protein